MILRGSYKHKVYGLVFYLTCHLVMMQRYTAIRHASQYTKHQTIPFVIQQVFFWWNYLIKGSNDKIRI